MGMTTACAQCRNTTTAMNASTTIALLLTMTDMCEAVGAGAPFESLSACTRGFEDVDMGLQRTMAAAAICAF
jgi:hypothetical protein